MCWLVCGWLYFGRLLVLCDKGEKKFSGRFADFGTSYPVDENKKPEIDVQGCSEEYF